MMRFRFHIGTIVIVVLVLGVGFAGLRESNDIWDSGVITITLGVLLISILLAIHRTASRGAFWLGFALFGSAYLALSLVPSIESRLITTRALALRGSNMPRSSPSGAGIAYFDYDNDGSVDLYVANNSQQSALYRNKGNGTFEDLTAAAGLKSARLSNISGAPSLVGSSGTTGNFIRIGHSLLALIAAFLGGLLSRNLRARNRERTLELVSSETGYEPTEPLS